MADESDGCVVRAGYCYIVASAAFYVIYYYLERRRQSQWG
jgi:hypothetical protein